jgi:hypothetical protein
MTVSLRLRLPFSMDFGNPKHSTQGLPRFQAADIGAPLQASLSERCDRKILAQRISKTPKMGYDCTASSFVRERIASVNHLNALFNCVQYDEILSHQAFIQIE